MYPYTLLIALALCSFAAPVGAQSAIPVAPGPAGTPGKEEVVKAVQQMFSALESDDPARLRELTTPDFYAFDMGRKMSAEQLVDIVKDARAAGTTFDWHVTEPQVHMEGHMAWITYVNRGVVRNGTSRKTPTWLESVVLRKVGDSWRIGFLHSTMASNE